MKLSEAILSGEARAYGQFSDIIRKRGGTYCETVKRIHEIFAAAGRVTTSADIEDKFAECDDIEARS